MEKTENMEETTPTVWTPEKRTEARTCATIYAGTPHFQNLNLPGTGVDCIHFVMAILRAANMVPAVTLPYYDSRIGHMREHNIMEDIFLEYLHAARTAPPYNFGDIIICRVGRQTNHVGIIMDEDEMWHVPAKGAVGPEHIINWMERVQCALRITKPGLRAPVTITAAEVLARACETDYSTP